MSHQLSIVLNDANGQPLRPGISQPFYSPGQKIIGTVHLKLTDDNHVPVVTIRFRGKVDTSITTGTAGNNQHTHRYNQVLFSFEEVLFDGGNHKLRATNYQWPFSFTFPETHTMSTVPFSSNSAPWGPQERGVYRLPSSCVAYDHKKDGSVDYELRAKVLKGISWRSWVGLNFSPFRLEADPDPIPKTMPQAGTWWTVKWRYGENSLPRALTTKESMKDVFKGTGKSVTNVMGFKVKMTAPTVIVVGRQYAIGVEMNCAATDLVLPSFTIHHIRAHLKAYTNIRVDGTFSDYEKIIESKLPLLNTREGLDIELIPNTKRNINGVFSGELFWPPNFLSQAIARHYGITVHLKIKVLDSFHDISCRWENVLVLGAHMKPAHDEGLQVEIPDTGIEPPAFEEQGPAPRVGDDISPPAYVAGEKEK